VKDLASDWITQDGVCFVKENGLNTYKVTCQFGIFEAELLDKTLGYKEDGARTSSWNEMYYKLNAAHWQRHAERLAKELADVKAEKQEGQALPRYKAGDRVRCKFAEDWLDGTVKYLLDKTRNTDPHAYCVKLDAGGPDMFATEMAMEPIKPRLNVKIGDTVRNKQAGGEYKVTAYDREKGRMTLVRDSATLHGIGDDCELLEKVEPPVPTFRTGDKVRLKWDAEGRTWEIDFMYDDRTCAIKTHGVKCPYFCVYIDDLTPVEAAK